MLRVFDTQIWTYTPQERRNTEVAAGLSYIEFYHLDGYPTHVVTDADISDTDMMLLSFLGVFFDAEKTSRLHPRKNTVPDGTAFYILLEKPYEEIHNTDTSPQ